MTTKLITGTCLQLLRRYDKRPESYRAQLLEDVILFCLTFLEFENFYGTLCLYFFTQTRSA